MVFYYTILSLNSISFDLCFIFIVKIGSPTLLNLQLLTYGCAIAEYGVLSCHELTICWIKYPSVRNIKSESNIKPIIIRCEWLTLIIEAWLVIGVHILTSKQHIELVSQVCNNDSAYTYCKYSTNMCAIMSFPFECELHLLTIFIKFLKTSTELLWALSLPVGRQGFDNFCLVFLSK